MEKSIMDSWIRDKTTVTVTLDQGDNLYGVIVSYDANGLSLKGSYFPHENAGYFIPWANIVYITDSQ